MTSSLHLRLDGVGFGHPGRRVLTDVSLTVAAGERTGLIGENGAGKSTLLHVAAGLLAPATGTVHRPERTGLLHQELRLPASATVGQVVEHAVAPVRALEHRLVELAARIAAAPEDPATADAYDAVLRDAERHGLWALDARVEAVLGGLGLGRLPRHRELSGISGGQRRRLALAALLLARPTALLLDEPTNHLDDDAADFLAAELTAWRGPVLLASHDRWFLDAVATGLVDLDPAPGPDESAGGPARQGTAFTGGYSAYLGQREDARRRWAERFAGFAPAAGAPHDGDRPLLRLAGASVAGRLAPTDLVLHAGERLLVEGPNGTGKSTLLGLLAGELRPDTGTVERQAGVVGRLAQDDAWPDLAVPAETAFRARLRHAERAPGLEELGLLRDGDAARALGELSPAGSAGGWRSRPWSPSPRRCCSWTSPPTTSRRPWPRSSSVPWRTVRAPWCWPRTTGGCGGARGAGCSRCARARPEDTDGAAPAGAGAGTGTAGLSGNGKWTYHRSPTRFHGGDIMVAAADANRWRKALAIGILSFAALGVAGCDDSESAGSDQGEEQQTPGSSGSPTAGDDATSDDMSPTEGEGPAEDEDPDAEDDSDT